MTESTVLGVLIVGTWQRARDSTSGSILLRRKLLSLAGRNCRGRAALMNDAHAQRSGGRERGCRRVALQLPTIPREVGVEDAVERSPLVSHGCDTSGPESHFH